jgi:DNA polymerase bacteriophage-type
MPVLHRDFETRSTLDLSEVGVHVYAAHSTTDLWCCAYAVNDEPVKLWVPGDPVPQEFIEAANNPDWLVCAHNDSFERTIEQHIMAPRYGWPLVPIERHVCTMAAAQALSLPAKLKTVAAVLQLKHQKSDDKLMRQMAKPRKPHAGEDPAGVYWHDEPERREKLYAYCRQDVEVERELHHRLAPLMPEEQALWQLDAQINDRGFYVEGKLLDAAVRVSEKVQDDITAELQQLTGGAVGSVNEVAKLIAWLAANDCEVPGADKVTLKRALTRKGLSPEVRRVIELRLEGAKAAANKLHTMRAWRNGDGRIRGAFRFHGASTGRWSSHGVQVQNMKRPEVEDIDAAIEAVTRGDLDQLRQRYPQPLSVIGDITRALVCAKPGHKLIAADFSGIESRVTAWLSGQQSKLDLWARFDRTRDPQDEPYFILGQQFGLAPEHARAIGKTADLAFGYQGGVGAWQKLAPPDDATDEAQIKQYQQRWHAAHPNTKKFWYDLNSAAVKATAYANTPMKCGRVGFEKDGTFLFMTLPSGRRLSYPFPRTQRNDRNDFVVVFKDNSLGKWVDCRYGQGMYGGVWIENAVQAVARDLFAAAMPQLEAAGFPIVLHVHDEIVCEVPDTFGAEEEAEFLRLMLTPPPWADGLPLGAKVRVGARFCKSKTAPQVDVSQDTETGAGADFRTGDAPTGSKSEQKAKECMKDKPANGGDNTYGKSKKQPGTKFEATFTWKDAGGRDYQRELKHRNPDGTKWIPQEYFANGGWKKGKKPKGWVELPYALPDLIVAAPDVMVCVTEGPKDAETLRALGFVATTNACGAGKFTQEHAKWFTGKQRVYVFEDNDADGGKHTDAVVRALAGIVPDIRVLRLPGLGDGEDVTDWLEKHGHTKEELLEQIKAAPLAQKDGLEVMWADEQEMCGIDWLWAGRFALGKIGLIAGLPDMGKGQIAAFLAAVVTRALALPCGEGNAPQGKVLWFNAEDDHRDTVIPRLVAAGADLKRIAFINSARVGGKDKTFNLATDLALLRRTLEDVEDVVLVIIDPMSAYLGVGKVDGHSATDVRGVLTPLKALVEEKHVALIGIAHFNKKDDVKSALLRVSDSIAYVAAARSVYTVLEDPEDKESKLFIRAKVNIAAASVQGLRYRFGVKIVGYDKRLAKDIDAPFIEWVGPVDMTANEALAAADGRSGEKLREAKEFLLERLKDGPVKADDIYEEAKQCGIAQKTLNRAKKELNIRSRKATGQIAGEWMWELPKGARQGE